MGGCWLSGGLKPLVLTMLVLNQLVIHGWHSAGPDWQSDCQAASRPAEHAFCPPSLLPQPAPDDIDGLRLALNRAQRHYLKLSSKLAKARDEAVAK